ncbi:MAG: OmpA family protein [Myxococcota bacterium]
MHLPSFRSPIAIAALLLLPTAAHAEYPTGVYLGLHGGAGLPLRPWDLGGGVANPDGLQADGVRPSMDVRGLVGARVGYQIIPRLGVELGASYTGMPSTAGGANTTFLYDLDAFFHFTNTDWAPYVLLGVGGYHALEGGDLGSDFDPTGKLGLGLRGLMLPWLALRVEARDIVTDGFDDSGANNLEFRLGLDLFPGSLKPKDSDEDGIPDEDDTCPTVAGVKSANGCPDSDGDSVTDASDNCADTPGEVKLQGCVDSDKDGIIDPQDQCPMEPGRDENGGCPDSDRDGVLDKDDACPDVSGKKELAGCPDADSDGIVDADDACPQDAGPRRTNGCPDRDKDGVTDTLDKCPDVPGLVDYEGCVPEAMKKFTGAIKGINFETGSARILSNSYALLDKAVAVMNEFPDVKLRIEGHTDDVGNDTFNLELSQDRADSVMAYLVAKAIDPSRLTAGGFGETRPVGDNKSSKGRSANRRIEFVLVTE